MTSVTSIRPDWEPVRKRNVHKQFQSRHLRYEEERLHGIQQSTFVPLKSDETKLPSQVERKQLTDKIALLLNDDQDDLFLASNDIADRQTVFAKLSDEEKSQASFAVSKVNEVNKSPKKKTTSTKITANVFESGQDTIKQYVKSMGQHQVLSPEDEGLLGRQIQVLNGWEQRRQELEETLLRPPTFKEWANAINTTVPELKKQIRRSQKSKAALVEANLRLVVTVARQTVKKGHSEINFQDACQEGILGLTRATEKFDPEKGFRFSSYAVWWIKKMIHKNVSDQSRQVRLPANVMRKINDIRIHEKVLQDELGRKAKDEEVAEKVGLTVEQLAFYRKSANKVISLDKKVKFTKESDNASNTPTMNDMVKDPSLSPAELAQKQMLKEDVRRLIKTLSPREQAVIRMRFGLDNGTPRTLVQIGDKFSVDKEMIRKIEAKALRKLRQPYRNQSLKSYITDL